MKSDKSSQYINRLLAKTERFQALFIWILLSIAIICCFFVKGTALPIILILISGIASYYVHIMVLNLRDKVLQINYANNDILRDNISGLSVDISQLLETLNNQSANTQNMIITCTREIQTADEVNLGKMINQFTFLSEVVNKYSVEAKENVFVAVSKIEESIKEESNKNLIAGNQNKTSLNESLSDVNTKLAELAKEILNYRTSISGTENKLTELTKELQNYRTSISSETEMLTNELMRCITASLSNYSESITNSTDESTNYIERLIEGINSKIEGLAKYSADQAEKSNIQLGILDREISLLNKANKASQNNDLNVLSKEELILSDIQTINSQLDNIRILFNTLKSSDIKANRKGNIEVIEDKANNLKINNIYEGEAIRKSEMYTSGKLKYYVEYNKEGKINYTKNHDLEGHILTEIYYFPDEQVKERIEWLRENGTANKVSTRFDKHGNKII